MTDIKNEHNVSHPFDREEEVSLQQLFTAFCNHLTLGQWELARVCFRGLFDSRRELGKPLKEILRAIIDQPQNASYGSPSVPSPFHLSWLCLVEYLDLFTSEEDQIPEPIVKKVEFHLLLYLACKDGPKNLVQDIDDYHSQIVYRDPNLFASGVSDLPSCTLLYLKQLLWKSPQFGHAVMKELSSKGKAFVKNNQLLQQLYLNLINEHLKELDSVEQRTEESDIDFINIQQRFIYRMLACMDPTSEMLELSESLDILFKDLLNRTFQDGPCHFDKGTLYSCFLGRSTTYLVNKFCAVENQMLFCSQEDQQLLQAPANVRQSHCHQCPSFPSSFAQICYNQSFIKDRKEAWRYLFFHALEGNHILENLVETALVFIRVEDYSRLKQLLSPAEFVKLKPLILLLGWPYCYSCENAKNLLEALWDPDEEAIDPSLYQACQKLAYQVQLVQWCTEKASPLLASSEGGSTRHQQASEMFQGLETHSVLHVLHKSIKLTRLPEKEVFELLRKRPVFSPFDTTDTEETSVDCVEKTSFIATHNDCSSEQSEDKLTDQTRVKKIHPEVERDVVLYHSYCALRNFMEAVTASASDCEFPEVADKTDSGATEDACSVTRDPTEDSDVEPKPLVLFATRKLQCGKGHLSHIYPLTYRVEILENIFSLLFGTYEDLYEGRGQQNESDSMETWDEETRSLAKSSRTASWESLTSSIDMSLELSPVKDKDKSAGLSTLTHSTPETAHAHKEVPDIPVAESQSRKQLFRIERSESDSALLKKTLDLSVDENLVSSAPPRDGQTRRTKQVDSEPVTTSSAVTPGKGSPGATGYDDDELKYGFVVEDELVPEVLKTLKECLLELNTAKFIGSKASPVANRSPGCLRTSVPDSAIEQRISRLGQFINEAHWRYQLVSWNDGSSSQKPGKDKKRAKKAQKALGTKEHVTGEDQQYETSEEAATEDKSGPDDNQGKRKKRKRRRRLASRSSASESMTPLVKDDSMIARMLSSPDTLTYMCMRKNNFERAFQVIKMFNMADKPSGQAAIFADKYAKSVKHLESLQPKERRIPRQGLSNSRQPLGALSAVAMAAASGVGTSLASNVIDDLLATPDFTAVLNPCLSPVELDNGNPALHKFLNPDLVPSMLCLDLACTASVSWPICKTLLDVGKGRVTKAAAFPSKSAGSLLGVAVFLNQLVQRLAQEQSRDSSKSSGGGIYIPITPKPNAMEILLSGTQPIRPKDMEAHTKTLASQEDSFRRLEVALDEGDTLIKSISEAYNQGPGHKHVGRQQSFNVMERSLAVRVGMIELQKAFDCVENASHVIRATGERVPERLDYIHSLFKHVESLATLLLFWQTRSPETLPMMDIDRQTSLKVTNPFVVLNEGIEDALGRPMFEKNISPKSLEGVAKKLNVNLSKVIVYNCCHGVPSRGGVTQADIRWPCSEPVILNAFSRWSESTRDPNTVAKDLLSRMIQLLKGVAQAHGGVVDSSSAVNAVNSPEFQAILHGTAELQTVDLDLLDSDASKICFFTNTLNLLIAHASLIQFTAGSSGETSEMETPFTRHASFTRLVDALSSSGGEVKVEGGIPPTSLERIAFLKQHSYCVGQLGPVSAFDLQYVMLHKGLLPPSTFGQGVIMCFPERLADDPKRKYRLTTAEKRVIFAICDGCVSSPPLQVFDVAELDAQLSAAVVSYINSRVTLHQQSGEVTMPELLLWYRKDFEDGHLDSSLIAQETDVSLLLQMEPYLYPDVASKLQEMLPQIKEISFTPFCWTFGYRFEPVLLERSFSSSGFQRSNSVPDNIGLSLELSVLKNSGKRGLFNLNETALEYLEEKSPLIAALVSLVSPAPHKVEQLFVRDIEQSGDHRSATDVCKPGPDDCANQSDELPLKHALQKTAKFPALQRCILTKLHTVADMLNVNPIESEERDGSYGSYDLIRLDSKPHFVQGGGVLRPPEICLYSVALAPDGGRPLQNALLTASDYYLREGLFEELFELINSSDLRGDGVGGPSIDFLLSSAILSKGGRTSQLRDKIKTLCSDLEIPEFRFSRSVHGRPWTLLPQIKDDESLARLVLTQLKERRAKDCIDLIDLCLSRPLKNVALRKELEKNGKEITLYRKIARCAKTQPFQAAITDDRGRSVSILKQWQGVAAASEEDPAEVIELLLSVQQFELAVEWAHLKSLPRHFHMIIQENHVKFLLENSPEDHVKAYRILETLHDQEMALSICESLLSQKLHVGPMLFIIQFMLTNLPSLLSPIRIEKLLCTKMGAKALLCLPEFVRCNYEHLVSRPLLLLEQLLMNMKVEWAAKVLKKIQVDLSSMEDVDGIGYHCCTVKAFDDLLTKYSTKALEFQVIQMERSQTKEFCSSIMQSLLKSTASSPAHSFAATDERIAAMQASGRHAPITSTPAKQRDVELATGSLDRKNMRPTQAAVLIPEKKIQRHSQTIAPRLSDLFGRKITVEESFKKATALISDQQSYIPPIVPPKREDWMPDLQVKSCVVCGEFFSMFNRRHHCRRCGRVVCGTCSQRNHQVAGYGKDPVRVCDTCYNYFYTDRVRSVRADVGSSLRSLPVSFEKGRSAHGVTEQPEYSVPSVGSSFMDSTQVANLLMEDINTAWKLRLDDEHNNLVREEFFYEQAPSASLCVSILDLHSDIKVCGRLILDLCNSLSQKLVPSAPGMRNEELDHNLVISMIRYLLFNAKLKMIKIGETQSVELCDTYLGHVDLLKFLVESNCGDIPSLRDLVHPDSARRLRDRFIESERLILAMEVSTKCGLDPSGVWGAVGFALLQAGDFPAAREKFARCMKSEGSSKQHQKQSAQYLKKIIQILESSPFLAFKQTTEELMGPLRGLMESSRNSQPGSSYLDPTRYDECLYYLQSYGSPTAMVDFYVKHNNIRLACRYILDKQCSVDVFIEMLKTCLALKGKFAQLKEQMEAADPTLQAWMPYLTAACKFLLQRSFYHALYELQVFMRDCFRAAQTCILFYSGVAGGSVTTYEDLYSRLHYLDKARQHIEEVIAEKRSPKGTVSTVFACLRQRNAGTAKGAAVMSLSDLDSHLNTINLQVEVTNFMHRCAVEGGVTSLLRAADIGRLPTLFGNGSVRAEMAVQVLLAGATVQDGFSLASRIIQDFNLPAARVYVDAGRSLARQYRYSHIEQLLRCSEETGQVTDKCHDDIILACVNVISADKSQAKRLEALIKLLKSDVNKINAFMMCGKLKSAYLVAQKSDRVQAIQEIYEVALKTGQSIMVEICRKFLSQYQKRQDAQQRRGPQKKHAGDLNR